MEQGARQRTVTAVAGELGELEEVLARKGSEPGVGLQACFDELQRIAVALGREQQWQQFLGDAVGQPRIGPGRDAGAAVLGVESSKRGYLFVGQVSQGVFRADAAIGWLARRRRASEGLTGPGLEFACKLGPSTAQWVFSSDYC